MTIGDADLTCDGFFGKRLQIYQPKQGYRAATDPVYLAAATPAEAGQSVLELGCGVGVALCCISERVAGLDVFGVEIQADYADLAQKNLGKNGFEGTIANGNIFEMPAPIGQMDFDHVIVNPPFFNSYSHTSPRDPARSKAHIGQPDATGLWVKTALKRLRPRGILTMIHRVEALPDILMSIGEKAGNINILPIAARALRPAGRVLVQAQKSMRGDLKLCPPFVVHTGAQHGDPLDGFSRRARAILRDGAKLPFC